MHITGEVYLIQPYIIKFVSDLDCPWFQWVLSFSPPTKLVAVIKIEIKLEVAQNLHKPNLVSCTTFVFSSLNVEEHIWFYTCLKGKPSKQAHAESDKLMKETGLYHRAKEFPDQLSGKEF